MGEKRVSTKRSRMCCERRDHHSHDLEGSPLFPVADKSSIVLK